MSELLLIDDDQELCELLVSWLAQEGFVAHACHDGQSARAALRELSPAAVVLDVMLPDGSGLELLKQLRSEHPNLPVLMLSGRGEPLDRILGLELGADDYLAKPFSMLELVARVRALLRRSEALERNARLDAGSLVLHGLSIDPVARTAEVDGRRLELTPREFDLLHFFARHPDKVFSRLDLLNQVWGYRHEGYEHTVNTHINRLRAKIEADSSNPRRILTVWGRGYKFAAAPAVAGGAP